jgi:hypothetical protein
MVSGRQDPVGPVESVVEEMTQQPGQCLQRGNEAIASNYLNQQAESRVSHVAQEGA